MQLPFECPLIGTGHTTTACALNGNQTSNPLIHRPAVNSLSHTSQGHWLILTCALVGHRTCNLGILEYCSNQLSYLAREGLSILNLTQQSYYSRMDTWKFDAFTRAMRGDSPTKMELSSGGQALCSTDFSC